MTSFILAIGLISLITGSTFLWLYTVIKEQKYFLFSLICFSASLYTLVKFIAFQNYPSSLYMLQGISMSGAIMMAPFVMNFAIQFAGKRSNFLLSTVYTAAITLAVMSLFGFHFFTHEASAYRYLLTDEAVIVYDPDIGYKIFMPIVFFVLVYCLWVFIQAYKRGENFIFPLLVGVSFLSVSGLYDTLWKQRVIMEPLYPMTEFGFLVLVAGMGITLIKQLLHNRSQTVILSARFRTLSQEETWLLDNLRTLADSKDTGSEREHSNNGTVFLRQVEKIIEENLHSRDFSAEKFADELKISRPHLNLKLKSLTGLPTTQLILNMRLERAALFLRENNATIKEIANRIGLPNVSYFSRRFKKHFGMTPGQYREHHSPADIDHTTGTQI